MSETPRTDKAYRICYTMGEADALEYAIRHGEELERELNEANEWIKKLEEDK
jgi:hypothetical protein